MAHIVKLTFKIGQDQPLRQSKADMRHNIWGNSNVCHSCHRLRDNQV